MSEINVKELAQRLHSKCGCPPDEPCPAGKCDGDYCWERIIEKYAAPQPAAGPCLWTWDTDGFWHTACGGSFYFDAGGEPAEDGFDYCPFCGAEIKLPEVKP